jgi:myo-inositol-1(or 4)-monophosphatase
MSKLEKARAADIATFAGRSELLAIALDVAREAGKMVERGWRHGVRAEHKGPVDLVTKFDRESERYLRDALHARTAFTVTGEEDGADAQSGNEEDDVPTWYVDPIDGTTNFVHGHFFYCVSVGLCRRNEPILGAIVAPSLHTEWTGLLAPDDAPGAPHKSIALRNGVPCVVSEIDQFTDALLATGFPYDRKTNPNNNFDAFVAIKKSCQAVRRCGSAALDMCLVADGTYDGYWERGLRPWDVAAGAAILVAAGGKLSLYDNSTFDVRKREIVATNQKIHDALTHALARVGR